jgi:hypothetical protein
MTLRQDSKAGDLEKDDTLTHVLAEGQVDDLYSAGEIDPVYAAKAHLLNDAMQSIGMGKYHWQLFLVAGFGCACGGKSPDRD